MLEKMRVSKAGWRWRDLERLYLGFGFRVKEGAKHRIVMHEDHKDLVTTITRATGLATGYIQTAVKLCDEARRRDCNKERGK